jgi:putative ABC transport system permease protein
VRENFLQAMEIPVVRGRGFSSRDAAGAPRVAVINETLAREYFQDRDPIGQRVGFDDKSANQIEIVGITRDILYNSQREEKTPLIYIPWLQDDPSPDRSFSVRAAGNPEDLVNDVRQAVRAVDPKLPVAAITTQLAQSRATLTEERQYATLIGIAGVLALGLAALGLYGVIAYWVTQRTNEIGLRMALGAQAASVLRLVLRQAMVLVIAGLAVGAASAFALTKLVQHRLFGVAPGDPLTIAVVGALLIAMALVACAIPARRAARLDPMIAFRID